MIRTLLVLCLSAAPLIAQEQVSTGEIGDAAYRIQIPDPWNHGLVMYTHGYLPRGYPWSPLAEDRAAVFLDRGYAVAESGYSRQGWAVEEALEETEELRRHFVAEYGEPDTTFLFGYSMGGLIAVATLEAHPEEYAGALPVCGPLLPTLRFFKETVFDMLVTFEAVFGDALDEGSRPLLEAEGLTREEVNRALDSDPDQAEKFATRWAIRRRDLPEILSLYHLLVRELADRAGGAPFDNRNTIYYGFGPTLELNARVHRVAADPKAAEYVREHCTLTGRIEDPIVAVHTSYDAGVPPFLAGDYELTLALAGNEKWFVQQYVDAEGHCNVAPALLGKAFDQLEVWASTGVRATPGRLSVH